MARTGTYKAVSQGDTETAPKIWAVCVYMDTSGAVSVLINKEVEVCAYKAVRKPRGEEADDGRELTLEVRSLEPYETPENKAYVLAFDTGKGWLTAFDFSYNSGHSRQRIEVAREFLNSAQQDLESKRYRALIENLFHAVEHSAKGLLMVNMATELHASRNHRKVVEKLKRQASLGNIDQKHADLFVVLAKNRGGAAYLDQAFSLDDAMAENLYMQAHKFVEDAHKNNRVLRNSAAAPLRLVWDDDGKVSLEDEIVRLEALCARSHIS